MTHIWLELGLHSKNSNFLQLPVNSKAVLKIIQTTYRPGRAKFFFWRISARQNEPKSYRGNELSGGSRAPFLRGGTPNIFENDLLFYFFEVTQMKFSQNFPGGGASEIFRINDLFWVENAIFTFFSHFRGGNSPSPRIHQWINSKPYNVVGLQFLVIWILHFLVRSLHLKF